MSKLQCVTLGQQIVIKKPLYKCMYLELIQISKKKKNVVNTQPTDAMRLECFRECRLIFYF